MLVIVAGGRPTSSLEEDRRTKELQHTPKKKTYSNTEDSHNPSKVTMADEKLAIYCAVTAQNGARTPISIDTDLTPTQLRKEVSDATKIPLDTLRLIFRGRMIQDNDESKVVDEYKLDKECVLHCMGAPAASGASASTSAPPSAAAAVPMSTTAGSSVSVPAASAPTAPPLTSTATATDPLKTALDTIRSNNPPATYLTAVQTLEKALTNIMTHPLEEKYRKVKQQNPAFRKRLGGLIGGDAAMLAAGFLTEMSNGEQVYMMHASPQAWPKLVASKTTIETAIQQARAGAAPPVMPMGGAAGGMAMPGMGGMAAPGGMPGMEGMGMPGGAAGMNPSMQNAMADMMSNPEALQSMLQVSTK